MINLTSVLPLITEQWVSIQAQRSQETVPMVQLALIGQTFGILSGVGNMLL